MGALAKTVLGLANAISIADPVARVEAVHSALHVAVAVDARSVVVKRLRTINSFVKCVTQASSVESAGTHTRAAVGACLVATLMTSEPGTAEASTVVEAHSVVRASDAVVVPNLTRAERRAVAATGAGVADTRSVVTEAVSRTIVRASESLTVRARPTWIALAHALAFAAISVSRTFAQLRTAIDADPAHAAVAGTQPAVPVAGAVAWTDLRAAV